MADAVQAHPFEQAICVVDVDHLRFLGRVLSSALYRAVRPLHASFALAKQANRGPDSGGAMPDSFPPFGFVVETAAMMRAFLLAAGDAIFLGVLALGAKLRGPWLRENERRPGIEVPGMADHPEPGVEIVIGLIAAWFHERHIPGEIEHLLRKARAAEDLDPPVDESGVGHFDMVPLVFLRQ